MRQSQLKHVVKLDWNMCSVLACGSIPFVRDLGFLVSISKCQVAVGSSLDGAVNIQVTGNCSDAA